MYGASTNTGVIGDSAIVGPIVTGRDRDTVVNMVGYRWRWVPPLNYVHHLIEQGYIGHCHHAHVQHQQGGAFGPSYKRQIEPAQGDGMLGMLGSHMIERVRKSGITFRSRPSSWDRVRITHLEALTSLRHSPTSQSAIASSLTESRRVTRWNRLSITAGKLSRS
jgi:hypothetical protein